MKRVMIITNIDSGLYDFRKEVVEGLLQTPYEVLIVAPFINYKERFEEMGCICIHSRLERRGMNPVKDLKLLCSYIALLRKYQPKVVLTYTIKPNVYGGIACQLTRIPYLSNITGLGTSLSGTSKMRHIIGFLYKIGLRKSRCVFFQNKYNRDFMLEQNIVQGKGRLLAGSGVNLEAFPYEAYPREEAILLLTVGRIMKDKGIRELLSIIPRICEEYPNVLFQLVGEYEVEDEVYFKPIIDDLQRSGMIRYYGYQEDVVSYMKQAHALIHPSYHEGMSNVLLEAASTGRPTVASDIPGCREIIQDGVTGYLCRPYSEESLYEGVRELLKKSVAQRERMGLEAREHVASHFNRQQVVQAYLEEVQSNMVEMRGRIRR